MDSTSSTRPKNLTLLPQVSSWASMLAGGRAGRNNALSPRAGCVRQAGVSPSSARPASGARAPSCGCRRSRAWLRLPGWPARRCGRGPDLEPSRIPKAPGERVDDPSAAARPSARTSWTRPPLSARRRRQRTRGTRRRAPGIRFRSGTRADSSPRSSSVTPCSTNSPCRVPGSAIPRRSPSRCSPQERM